MQKWCFKIWNQYFIPCNVYNSIGSDHDAYLKWYVIWNILTILDLTLNGKIKQRSSFPSLFKDREDVAQKHLDLINRQNEEGVLQSQCSMLLPGSIWAIQCFQTSSNQDKKNDMSIDVVRWNFVLSSHILQLVADRYHFTVRNATLVDDCGQEYDVNQSRLSTYARKYLKLNYWYVYEEQYRGYSKALKICFMILFQLLLKSNNTIGRWMKEFAIPDIVIYEHSHREISGKQNCEHKSSRWKRYK